MIKRFFAAGVILASFYVFFLFVRLSGDSELVAVKAGNPKSGAQTSEVSAPSQKVYSFSFSKYTNEGKREIEIEGDSADIFAKVVKLSNVIAKAYADEKPITITADRGVFDKDSSNIHLKENVVATSEQGAILRSDSLDIDITKRALSTEDTAHIERENVSLKGTGAEGYSEDKKIHFKKNVTVVIRNEKTGGKATVITCDGPLDVDYANNVAHFNENVTATDNRGKLIADYMDVHYDRDSRRVYKIVARGNVVIEQEGNVTYSDNVVYLAEEGRVIMGGDPEAVYYPDKQNDDKEHEPDYMLFGAPFASGSDVDGNSETK